MILLRESQQFQNESWELSLKKSQNSSKLNLESSLHQDL